jgi:outer membrane protein TolC
MRRVTLFLVLAIPLFATATEARAEAGGDPRRLQLAELPGLVLGHDTGAAISAQSTLLALHTYQGTVAEALPQIDFSTSYTLGYTPWIQSQSYYFTSSLPFINVYDLTTTDQANHQLSAKLSVSQLLPTAGSLYMSLEDLMTVDTEGGKTINGGSSTTADPVYSQRPRVSLSLSQPFFLNGKLLDLDLFPATLRKAQLGYLEQDAADAAQRNQTLGQAAQLYLSIVQLRKSVAQTRKTVEVTQGNLATMEKNFALGSVAEADLIDARIGLSQQRQALLELASTLAKTERLLSHSVGIEEIGSVELADELPRLDFAFSHEQILNKALSSHPLIRQKGLASEEKRVDQVLAGQQFASTLNVSFSWSPRYPYDSSNSPYMAGLSSSFGDLFASGSGQDYALTVGVTIHLFDGGKQAENRAGGDALRAVADQGLVAQRQTVQDQVELDLLQKASLEEKVALLVDASALAERRHATEQNLLTLGKSTDLLVAGKAADAEARANELWRARADLYLTVLDLYSLAGDNLARLIEGNGI